MTTVYLMVPPKDFDCDFQEEFDKEYCQLKYSYIPAGVLAQIKEGDFLDVQGYRGTGLYYYNGKDFIKTEGEYGYFLPSDAWKMVQLHGLEFFKGRCGAEYILLPKGVKIETKGDEHLDLDQDRLALSINCTDNDDDYVIIDNVKYQSTIYERY